LIFAIVRTSTLALLRDRGALALNFILPLALFSIFALVFGARRDTTARVRVLLVNEDGSRFAQHIINGMQAAGPLDVRARPEPINGAEQPAYTVATATSGVRNGVAPVAVVLPAGLGDGPVRPGTGNAGEGAIQMLVDVSDPVAPLMVSGTLKIVTMRAIVESRDDLSLHDPNKGHDGSGSSEATSGSGKDDVPILARNVVGEKKRNPLISFYAAGIGVLFLLFSASGTSGILIEESDNGTLDRILSSRVAMTSLLVGKLAFSSMLAFVQLTLMFVWGWAVFKLDLWTHIPGFLVMGVITSVTVAAFGLFLASLCRTRAQLGAFSYLIILAMSSVGGSMFPRYLMPMGMQKAGLLTINAWAIEGFTKVFWRDERIIQLWPQVLVLSGAAAAFLVIARLAARRWEAI
jgi:ABC-2 type transport system permease protein